jgi:U4/U6.U5 tri-snRNP-associated protein 2
MATTLGSSSRIGGNDHDDDGNGNDTNHAGKKRKAPFDTSAATAAVVVCPYLDTVQRSLLDFDFEPACSVSLETGPHIYGCLVCGKFFRGKGKQSPAYTHAVDEGHFVYVHLWKGTFHCLPDDYEIFDPSLSDISAALHPTFSTVEIQTIDTNAGLARDLFGRQYLPGFVGLNNLNKTDYINSTIQALVHVRPLRDYFLRLTHRDSVVVPTVATSSTKRLNNNDTTTNNNNNNNNNKNTNKPPARMSDLVRCFGELVRKVWSDRRFKSHVDPHMLIQAIGRASKNKYQIGRQAEVGEFIAWFLHQLHIGLGGTRKARSSIIYRTFQGTVEVTTRQRKQQRQQEHQQHNSDRPENDSTDGVGGGGGEEEMTADRRNGQNDSNSRSKGETMDVEDYNNETEEITIETTFLQLTLDIPEKPLFRDDEGGLVIPQEPLVSVMKKFDGVTFSDAINKQHGGQGGSGQQQQQLLSASLSQRKRYRLIELPPYLILHLTRFKTNNYSKEKNPTIVAFPVKNLDLSSYTFPRRSEVDGNDDGGGGGGGKKTTKNKKVPPTEEEVRRMSVRELQMLLKKYGRDDIATHAIEKGDLVEATVDFVVKSLPDLLADKYDLVANITHDSPADVGREGKTDPLQMGSYKCHVHHKASNHWYEIQDLHVQETMPQLIGVSESYVLIFERKSAQQMDLSK